MKGRIHYWDNIKGVLIFLVVFAHCLYDNTSSTLTRVTVDAIYMFHMASFVFVSGYFGKSPHAQSADSILKLTAAYFIFNGITGIIYNSYTFLTPHYSYWYILALIIWRFIGARLAKIKNIIILLCGLSLLIGFIHEITNTFALTRVIAFSPFYIAGYLTSEIKIQQNYMIKSKRNLLLGCILLFFAVIIGSFSYRILNFSQNELQMFAYENYSKGCLGRFVLIIISSLAIQVLLFLTPNKEIPCITRFGCCSFSIFLFHRIFTLWFSKHISIKDDLIYFLTAFIFSIILCLLFSIKSVSSLTNTLLNIGSKLLQGENCIGNKALIVKTLLFAITALLILHFPIAYIIESCTELFIQKANTSAIIIDKNSGNNNQDEIYRVMTSEQQLQFKHAFRILFVGDLILLEDQVKRGYKNGYYDFSDLFEYTKKYISSADLAIGVLEGPTGGADIGYSTSNYGDHKELALNFPDEFAIAIKKAGFDLVTTANNHLLDKGVTAAHRTMDFLDSINLDHIGSWRSQEEKELRRIKIIEKDNLRFAIIAYTYGSNGYTTEQLMGESYRYITSVLPDIQSPLFEEAKTQVAADFELAKNLDPDFIIVLPHLGTQFTNLPDENQKVWYDLFVQNGADIILGDHSHSIQPVMLRKRDDKSVFTLYCPGNYANVYREYHGDATAMVEVYIDRTEKKIIGGSIVPMFVQSTIHGNFRPIPIWDIEYNRGIQTILSTDDVKRAEDAHALITTVMLNHELPLSMIQSRYYFDEHGFIRLPLAPLKLDDGLRKSPFMQTLHSIRTICFVGDSITHGTKNGGVPWYEPIAMALPDHRILQAAFGGATSKDLLGITMPKADLYVIAIGTNDIRYRDHHRCAMTPLEFIETLTQLREQLVKLNPYAKFVFIAPWTSTDGDPFSQLNYFNKMALNQSYSKALAAFAYTNGDLYIDPNPMIMMKINQKPVGYYLLDHIHPNVSHGIELYSESVLKSSDSSSLPLSFSSP